jgi:hypothetical protein
MAGGEGAGAGLSKDVLLVMMPPNFTSETTAMREVLDPHIAWAIGVLLLALIAAIVALVTAPSERRQ